MKEGVQDQMHPSFVISLRTRLLHVGLLLLLLMLSTAPVAAQGGAISQAYQTSTSGINQGVLVSTVASGSTDVKPADTADASMLVGVAAEEPELELSSSGKSKSSVQVVVGGSTEVLVSDANGAINAGDKIAVSPLAGIGMKATGAGEVVGTAQKALSSVKTVTQEAKGTNGQTITVHVGLIPVAINVVYYTAVSSGGTVSAYVPPFLQTVANTIAGKAVSPLRVLVGTVALLLGFFAVIIMLYVGVRSGVISLGRNPLAADALRRGMVDVLIAALGILVVTGVIVSAVILV
ncbi:MAG TPA: hypothetical protein VMB52_04955 [Verrucomicrobiae bacterium]|nr:hypothetical protein [Verrucomicrobiae bacterium]